MDNMQNIKYTHRSLTAGQLLMTVFFCHYFKGKDLFLCSMPYTAAFVLFIFFMPKCKLNFRTSLHSLVQITSFVSAEWVEGGYHKLPIESAAR